MCANLQSVRAIAAHTQHTEHSRAFSAFLESARFPKSFVWNSVLDELKNPHPAEPQPLRKRKVGETSAPLPHPDCTHCTHALDVSFRRQVPSDTVVEHHVCLLLTTFLDDNVRASQQRTRLDRMRHGFRSGCHALVPIPPQPSRYANSSVLRRAFITLEVALTGNGVSRTHHRLGVSK